jgi:hypothetical protein
MCIYTSFDQGVSFPEESNTLILHTLQTAQARWLWAEKAYFEVPSHVYYYTVHHMIPFEGCLKTLTTNFTCVDVAFLGNNTTSALKKEVVCSF